jgi:hypothetical protein
MSRGGTDWVLGFLSTTKDISGQLFLQFGPTWVKCHWSTWINLLIVCIVGGTFHLIGRAREWCLTFIRALHLMPILISKSIPLWFALTLYQVSTWREEIPEWATWRFESGNQKSILEYCMPSQRWHVKRRRFSTDTWPHLTSPRPWSLPHPRPELLSHLSFHHRRKMTHHSSHHLRTHQNYQGISKRINHNLIRLRSKPRRFMLSEK